MTKPSAILLVKRHPLDGFSEFERSIIRRFLFDCIHGVNEQHEGRWRRLWRRLWTAEPGQVFQLDNVVERSGPFHSRHMAIEQRLFDQQDYWPTLKAMRDWLKVGAGWVEWKVSPKGGIAAVPCSTSYEKCSDDEMREVHEAMLAFLRTSHAQRVLWAHLPSARRTEMLESVLADREEEGARP